MNPWGNSARSQSMFGGRGQAQPQQPMFGNWGAPQRQQQPVAQNLLDGFRSAFQRPGGPQGNAAQRNAAPVQSAPYNTAMADIQADPPAQNVPPPQPQATPPPPQPAAAPPSLIGSGMSPEQALAALGRRQAPGLAEGVFLGAPRSSGLSAVAAALYGLR